MSLPSNAKVRISSQGHEVELDVRFLQSSFGRIKLEARNTGMAVAHAAFGVFFLLTVV